MLVRRAFGGHDDLADGDVDCAGAIDRFRELMARKAGGARSRKAGGA
jgi:hypothetical protein